MPRAGFEPTTSVFKLAETFPALDGLDSVIGVTNFYDKFVLYSMRREVPLKSGLKENGHETYHSFISEWILFS
jgi:hypothetical protein